MMLTYEQLLLTKNLLESIRDGDGEGFTIDDEERINNNIVINYLKHILVDIDKHKGGNMIKRVYVAGSYNADNVIKVLNNIKRGTQVCVELLKRGYIPFCPWLDFQFSWFEDITRDEYLKYSMGWLEVSDCIYVLKNSEKSKGTQAEIIKAKELNIPILYEGRDNL